MPFEDKKHLYFRKEVFMKYKKFDILNLIAALVLSVGIMTVFQACALQDNGSWMKCHDAQLYIFYIGIVITLLSLLYIFINSRLSKLIINTLVIGLAILQAFLPGNILSMCSLFSMRCYTIMKPFSIIMGVILVLLSVIKMIPLFKEGKKEA